MDIVKNATKSIRVTLVHGWHDDNKGDCAIVMATLDLIGKHSPSASLGLVSTLSADNPSAATAYRHILQRFPGLRIAYSPVVSYQPAKWGGRATGIFLWLIRQPSAILRLIFGWSGRNNDALDLIRGADLVISKGGHIFHCERDHPMEWVNMYRRLFPLLLAWRFNVPYVLLGQSFGPFRGGLAKRAMTWTVSHAKAVFAREEISVSVLANLGVDKSKLKRCPDLAFSLRPSFTPRFHAVLERNQLKPKRFWAVTVRKWPTKMGLEKETVRFIKEMEILVRRILDEGRTERVALIAHTVGPIPIECDVEPTRRLAETLKDLPITLIEEDLSPEELMALYGEAELLIGTRFHSVILALASGTPALAVSYFGPKALGIMSMLGMSDLCLEMGDFSWQKALAILGDNDWGARRESIREKVATFRKELDHVVADVLVT